jgi:peptidoglycan hydrolase-like amidase
VCDTTACQVYDPDSSQGSTDAATDATAKNVLVQRGTDTVAKAEYAAENNHHVPCNDGQTGDGSSWPCADDKVCLGQAVNGHGRGMCQNGSQRWASQSSKDMDWILTHYYPNFDKVVGN